MSIAEEGGDDGEPVRGEISFGKEKENGYGDGDDDGDGAGALTRSVSIGGIVMAIALAVDGN